MGKEDQQYPASPIEPPSVELYLKNMDEAELFQSILNFGREWSEGQKIQVLKAYLIASEIFKSDVYKEDPYICHLLRVANRIVGYMEMPDWELAVGAILHDAKEDHPEEFILLADKSLTKEDLAEADIQDITSNTMTRVFTSRISAMVNAVSNPPSLSKKNYDTLNGFLEAYTSKVEMAIEAPDGWIIKFADWCDNGLGVIYSDLASDKIEILKDKYGRALPLLEKRYQESDVQEMVSPNANAYVRQQFAYGHERLKAA